MKTSVPNLKREITVQQNRQTGGQPINNEKNEMIKSNALTDLTKEQWFWDKAVLS